MGQKMAADLDWRTQWSVQPPPNAGGETGHLRRHCPPLAEPDWQITSFTITYPPEVRAILGRTRNLVRLRRPKKG